MTGVQINNEYLDLPRGTVIQRERNSPFWLTATGEGKDGIPGETSTPFNLPLSQRNRRLLGHVGTIPVNRQRMFDARLTDDVYQLSAGKMVVLQTNVNLNNPDAGSQQAYLLHNSSHFFKSIEGKKLTSLSLGGERSFNWQGYTYTGTGFWAHAHATWQQLSCDDGDYVFFPVGNPEYKGYSTMVNRILQKADGSFRLDPNNVTSLCPHIYLSYILRQIFREHGYTLTGDILNDEGFKQICMVSMVGVAWSTIGEAVADVLPLLPKPVVTFNLHEHLPPEATIAEFLVELCKFLPLGFVVDDNTRSCQVHVLGRQATTVKDWTYKVRAEAVLPQPDSGKELKKIALTRDFSDSNQYNDFVPSDYSGGDPNVIVYLQTWTNQWTVNGFYDNFGNWVIHPIAIQLASNIGSYRPEGTTDSISCKLTPIPDVKCLIQSVPANADQDYMMPYLETEGNWAGKPEPSDWGMRITFYKGNNSDYGDGAAPNATSHGGTYVNGGGQTVALGGWSMAFDNGTEHDMLHRWWARWLKVLEQEEGFNGICHMPLLEYMQFRFSDTIQIQNTNYLIKKINDVLPYPGWFAFEAVRVTR